MKPTDDSNPSAWPNIAIVLVAALTISAYSYYRWSIANKPWKSPRPTSLISDGRILGNAAQQYFLTSGKTQASFGYNPATGEITGDVTPWIKVIGKGYSIPETTIESGASRAFSIQYPYAFNGQTVTFSEEGKTTFDPNQP